MDFVSLADKGALVAHKADIEQLFLECFGDRLSVALWDWAYLQNPHGEPLVSLCYDEGRLVGHYAMVPMPLAGPGRTLNSYLSMTTMVSATHRQHGLFVKLADATYQKGAALGIDFVMGFPNAMSTPGFRRKLNWVLPEPDYVAAVSKAQIIDAAELLRVLAENTYALDLRDSKTREWRMSRPGSSYIWQDGLVYKRFADSIDLMYFDSIDALRNLPDEGTINLLVPHEFEAFRAYAAFDYQFGGFSIKSEFVPALINRQMCLSDVF